MRAMATAVAGAEGGKEEARVSQLGKSSRFAGMRVRGAVLAALFAAGLAAPQVAQAQFSDSYKFLEAVRKSDNDAVVKALEVPGVTPVNTKDRSTGETALHITIARRDLVWSSYMLTHGARPDMLDHQGRSPLMVAVEKRFLEGAQLLLSKKANPNLANGSGETPLIRAVQLNDIEMVRALLGAGADANRRDTLAGMSALDYAKRDNRMQSMIDLLSAETKAAPAKGVQGPRL